MENKQPARVFLLFVVSSPAEIYIFKCTFLLPDPLSLCQPPFFMVAQLLALSVASFNDCLCVSVKEGAQQQISGPALPLLVACMLHLLLRPVQRERKQLQTDSNQSGFRKRL